MTIDNEINNGNPAMVVTLKDDSFVVLDLVADATTDFKDVAVSLLETLGASSGQLHGPDPDGDWVVVPLREILLVKFKNMPEDWLDKAAADATG
jgi:hypothetical protein